MSDFKAKMHEIQFRLGLAYSIPPDHLPRFKWPTSKGREGREGKGGEGREEGGGGGVKGRGWGGRGKGKGGKGGDMEGCGKWSAPGPALALGGPVHRTRIH